MTRGEQIAAVLADLNVSGWRLVSAHGCDGTEEVCAQTCPVPMQEQVSPDEIAAALLAVLAAQEGERGGAEVAAAVEAVLAECDARVITTPDRVLTFWVRRLRAALADPAGALAKRDAEVLRAAAEDFSTQALSFSNKGWGSNPVDQAAMDALVKALAWLRERADRIAGGQS